MTYKAKMKDGSVIFEGDKKPAEGAELRVEWIDEPTKTDSLSETLLKFAGVADGPADASVNVDHYLYGLPKVNE